MKQLTLLLAVGLLLTTVAPLPAQSVVALRGGVTIATFGGDDVDNPGSRTGVNVGASFAFPLSETVGLQLGAAYTQKGAEDSDSGITGTFEIDYIEIPALLRFAIPSEGAVSAHLLAGPTVAFEASCNASISGSGGSISADCAEADIDTKSIDFGATGGIGLDIDISEDLVLVLDALYTLGLTSIDDSGGDVKNRAFTLQAGLGFPLG